jgi:hypothetical protein
MKIFTLLFAAMFTTMVVAAPIEETSTQLTQDEAGNVSGSA